MNFNSLTFILFLPVVFLLYWSIRRRTAQNMLLIASSYFFYAWWDYRFCALMLISSLVDYWAGAAIARSTSVKRRRFLLCISLACNLGLLGVFKYFNFFLDNLVAMADQVGWQLNPGTVEIILPVGISFFTFQTLSYTIDIFRGRLEPTGNLIDYLVFVSFFPQLVAGPIERASHLLPQFASERRFDLDAARDGCRQILFGLFKKIAIADALAEAINPIYAAPHEHAGPVLILATVMFAFQIYCDFSGYSDIAIGAGRLLGINLMRNFAYPYFSQSVSEFWRRWHISLSTWFRDYVFIPLGGSRTSRAKRALNIFITFVISGFWHGAAWKFVAWGGLNGIGTIGHKSTKIVRTNSEDTTANKAHEDTPGGESFLPKPVTLLRMLATFTFICICWVFFRADHMSDALMILQKVAGDLFSANAYSQLGRFLDSDSTRQKTLFVLVAFVLLEWTFRRSRHVLESITAWPTPARWATYTALIWFGLDLMPEFGTADFIYFAF